jgi:phosphate-selective porin OprO and OprP
MNKVLKYGALAAFIGFSGAAMADKAETKGGLTIKTEDGRFEGKLGGRIHFDAYLFGDQETNGVKGNNSASGTEFRRARITLSGKAYGWEYKFEEDFAGDGVSERDLFIAKKLGPGKLTIGQFKPYRSMEELTSSNEVTMMERPFSSASALYDGRQFQQGLGYLLGGNSYTAGGSVFTLRDDSGSRTEALGYAARVTVAPLMSDGQVVHLGLSYSAENLNTNATPANNRLRGRANYAGRRGPSVSIYDVNNPALEGSLDVIGLEAAMTAGPFYAQAEYAMGSADLGKDGTGAAVGPDRDITSYYVMTSFHLTGESKPYKKGNGVFGSVKPKNASGAVELTARYDYISGEDDMSGAVETEATALTVGANYYVNPNVRFMLNYTMGETETGPNKIEADQLALRTQFSF